MLRLIVRKNKQMESWISLDFSKALNKFFPGIPILLDLSVSFNTAAHFFLFCGFHDTTLSLFPSHLYDYSCLFFHVILLLHQPVGVDQDSILGPWFLPLSKFSQMVPSILIVLIFTFALMTPKCITPGQNFTPSLKNPAGTSTWTCPKPNSVSPPQIYFFSYIPCLNWWPHPVTPTPETWKSVLPPHFLSLPP